ncbi:hypothetical protein HNQ95_003642 [Aminobacter ciceronei]|jgi:hypothetical protein|uniref:Uncharacterized protein n=2 Tax=Aminobacter TaxID=31988 RepID=A0AAC8YTD3_AMIAI|nr:hypothetical protein AA2016_5205 [Aminobacter aminovorans]MBA8907858.1 hypothetical protein [Aminobacter ciceronei]MBA9021630.1 hypothetical protein [Aminobacter ciceronei]MBB3705497.1 hypothetical protein [Aminobacter aminovorans]
MAAGMHGSISGIGYMPCSPKQPIFGWRHGFVWTTIKSSRVTPWHWLLGWRF